MGGLRYSTVTVMSSVFTGDLVKRNAAGATRRGRDDVGQLAEIDVEIFGEQIIPTCGVAAVSTGIAPQTPPAVHV
jgi:hypothetical protein